jgi:molybdopterin synthase sulfur carrier subunit
MIHIRFFASLREQLGLSSMNLEYGGEKTVLDLMTGLFEKSDKWKMLSENDVLVAVNQTLCAKDARINDGDEIAFFPPVTGG